MTNCLDIDVITIFPGMLDGFLRESMMKRAEQLGLARFNFINPRDFTTDVHRTVDDRPYGGGPGMVMKPEPLFEAIESVRRPDSSVILMTPQGRPFNQGIARELKKQTHLICVCGHYEGVDERIRQLALTDEISIGDYVLTNGALAAAVLIDAVVRLLPGVLGAGEEGTEEESFTRPLLEYPHYTRPPEFKGLAVPEILLSGNHAAIRQWREEQAVLRTHRRRPDLLEIPPPLDTD
ncbi:MAG: tRNA (guanosine(37)-N1)-methyltransferase TrmD [Kiritimatiellae bacterium]|nr:tRNA (guanosine(37)-N1)-methyltransferase TrmD [Kiritimatiellia bacterium]